MTDHKTAMHRAIQQDRIASQVQNALKAGYGIRMLDLSQVGAAVSKVSGRVPAALPQFVKV